MQLAGAHFVEPQDCYFATAKDDCFGVTAGKRTYFMVGAWPPPQPPHPVQQATSVAELKDWVRVVKAVMKLAPTSACLPVVAGCRFPPRHSAGTGAGRRDRPVCCDCDADNHACLADHSRRQSGWSCARIHRLERAIVQQDGGSPLGSSWGTPPSPQMHRVAAATSAPEKPQAASVPPRHHAAR